MPKGCGIQRAFMLVDVWRCRKSRAPGENMDAPCSFPHTLSCVSLYLNLYNELAKVSKVYFLSLSSVSCSSKLINLQEGVTGTSNLYSHSQWSEAHRTWTCSWYLKWGQCCDTEPLICNLMLFPDTLCQN